MGKGISPKILDKDVQRSNYGTFQKCIIDYSGKTIKFVYANKENYTVSIDFFLKWNKYPHTVFSKNRWKSWSPSVKFSKKKGLFKKWRRILSNSAIQVYLSNGVAYTIPWDTVLMACEPRYEHYGGFTEESQTLIKVDLPRFKF